jgi:hypothetical protein
LVNDNGHEEIDELSGLATAEAEHDVFKGARIKLGELERQDGLLSEEASKSNKTGSGVLLRTMTAYPSDKDYRQILKSGNYPTREKAREAVKAIDECRLVGYTEGIKSILDDVTAQAAGDNYLMLRMVLDAIQRTTFQTNSTASRKNWWGKNDTGKSNTNPLS